MQYRVAQLTQDKLPKKASMGAEDIKKLITIFRELRSGRSEDGEIRLKSPSATLSTAEAISAVTSSQNLVIHFSSSYGKTYESALAENILSAAIKDDKNDREVFMEYLETVMRTRKGWKKLYDECKNIIRG